MRSTKKYNNQIEALLRNGESPTQIARKLWPDKTDKDGIDIMAAKARRIRRKLEKLGIELNVRSESNSNEYMDKPNVMSAIGDDGRPMDIDVYCEHYGLDRAMISSFKLVSHTGIPYYNIVFREQNEDATADFSEVFKKIKKSLKGFKRGTRLPNVGRTGVVTISDIHMGAWVKDIDGCPDFDLNILTDKLIEIADRVNALRYDNVVVVFLGDYVEGVFSKHKNSWQGMENGLFGAEMIITAVETLSKALLERIDNLQEIRMVSGNHDCLSPDKNDDPDYGVGALIAYGLKLKGYNVDSKNHVNVLKLKKHCFILTHGDHFKSASAESMALRFGVQGSQNIILKGHFHSRKVKVNHSFMDNDSADVREYTIASVFTGNSYSSNLGFTSTSGFSIFEEHDKGGLTFMDITIN